MRKSKINNTMFNIFIICLCMIVFTTIIVGITFQHPIRCASNKSLTNLINRLLFCLPTISPLWLYSNLLLSSSHTSPHPLFICLTWSTLGLFFCDHFTHCPTQLLCICFISYFIPLCIAKVECQIQYNLN